MLEPQNWRVNKLVAFEYQFNGKDAKLISLVKVQFMKESRSMFGSSNYENLIEPKIFLYHIQDSCTNLKYSIFRYFFPFIKLPQQYRDAFETAGDKENVIKKIFEAFYTKSDYGKDKVMRFKYENAKNYYNFSDQFVDFDEEETIFEDFIDGIKSDEELVIRVYFPKESRVDIKSLENYSCFGSSNGTL